MKDSIPRSHPIRVWLVDQWHWPAATLFAACFLFALAPVLLHTTSLALMLVYLQLPIYMLHQGEEHTEDRFRLYINRVVCGGREALTPLATFWINSLLVWGVDLLALYLACFVELSFGLIAIYLPLLNSLGHILPALGRREYNPGLWTSLALFLPFGGWALYEVTTAAAAGWPMQLLGLGSAVAIHGIILVHVFRRLARLPRVTTSE